jgi:uncharacterized protein
MFSIRNIRGRTPFVKLAHADDGPILSPRAARLDHACPALPERRFHKTAARSPIPPMTSHEFSFPVSELDPAGKQFRRPVRPAWLREVLDGTAIGPSEHDGELDVRLSKSGDDVVVRGSLSAVLIVPCARCLSPAVVPVREELSVMAVPSAAAPKRDRRGGGDDDGDDADADPGEADVIAYEGDSLLLDDLVRDELLLGIPMIPLCSEACPGIRPEQASSDASSAEDESIDPRLPPLLKLKTKS